MVGGFTTICSRANDSVPLGYSISAFLAGFALTGTPAKLGEAVKGVFLKQDYDVPVTRVVGIVMVERLMDLWGVLLLGSFSLMMFRGWRGLFLLTGLAVLAGGAFLCMERLYRPVLERLGRISYFKWVSEKALTILLTGRDLMTPRIFAVGLVVSAIAWGMEAISLYVILEALRLPATILQANFVYCFSTILGAVSMLPGGIGGTEAGMIGLLGISGDFVRERTARGHPDTAQHPLARGAGGPRVHGVHAGPPAPCKPDTVEFEMRGFFSRGEDCRGGHALRSLSCHRHPKSLTDEACVCADADPTPGIQGDRTMNSGRNCVMQQPPRSPGDDH